MNFIELTKEKISDFIINDPRLIYLGFSDQELAYMHEHKEYKLCPGSYYIGIEEEGELVCVFKWEQFTEICINYHAYISSKYHGTDITDRVFQFMYQHLRENTKIKKVIMFVPDYCTHVIKGGGKRGFKKEGYISNSIVWRKELMGINIYGFDLYERQ